MCGMCGRGHVWQGGGWVCMAGGHAWWGACAGGGACVADTVNERAVRILLECILVVK